MDKNAYDKLFTLDKVLNRPRVRLAGINEQKCYFAHGLFDVNKKFTVIMNCKGHKKKKLSLMIRSSDGGNMMRFDIIGKSHHGYATPHLHIFNSENIFDCEFIEKSSLPFPLGRISNDFLDFQKDLEIFFIYNKVKLDNVVFVEEGE
ncbi:hypothetical protein [Companilactobacillus sp. HBUAS56275]|uniref:Uncharacterized protein n=1 Tax=Candidatus Companilactobacillus pullicola TaxID=2838523 RepID=A0A9D1ZPJ5_9LACO|nr:hypothetical protein [Candidatus Companilactobacillus pullicola]